MRRNRFLPIIMIAALLAQAVIAGLGHSHVHLTDGTQAHGAGANHYHHHAAHFHSPVEPSDGAPTLPHSPSDDDCSICRHLALAAVLTLDLEPSANEVVVEPIAERESRFYAPNRIGLLRSRAPPKLS